MSESLSSEERQNNIANLLARQGRLSVREIVKKFKVSQATARRDLEALAEQGRLQRVHGGAIPLQQAPPELPILQRASEQADEKIRIGSAVAALVEDGETIFLGSGTTVAEVALALKHRRGLTVITNSLPVLNTLSIVPSMTVIALGGMLRNSELSFIGHITEQALAEIHADKVIIGIHALSLEHGLTNDYMPETMTDRAILHAGREVIVAADYSKINTVSIAFLAPITSIHTLVTDSKTPSEFRDALAATGIRVIVA
jgi:DeoR family transcriptional regulator, aga operon transcriptional repressor